MRILFELDQKNYDETKPRIVRPSVRGIILNDGKIYMVHSLKYDYYKFPGGGIEAGEDPIQTLSREVREESGLIVIPETIRDYGMVRRIEAGVLGDVFEQENYYYLCEVEAVAVKPELDDYEADEQFTLELVHATHAIQINRTVHHGPKNQTMLEREARVLEILIHESYL